ncbi:hypothetical protein QE360_001496 [Sphingomonas sp. SORGH_AS789]|nr:hypothetical protein [Sphingomonas sp. SORGH_AS_0789]MDR6151800.1 hypothetical protein [Sphingomonas sp. SORGH_AS_0742]
MRATVLRSQAAPHPFSLSEVEGQGMTLARWPVRGMHFDFAQCERR